ncbi:MAG: hypothetical protein GYB27_21590 [Rhodobacteraceae bacterium]|nr:hypothetical protein [Paracoccaceae bacterium]
MKINPLDGVRVLNLGGSWAGRVAAMLLADQGAEVIEIDRPGREEATHDAALGRGKTVITADLKDAATAAHIRDLAADCDIVFDNLGAGRATRFGLSAEQLRKQNPGLVHISMPGFAAGSELADVPAYEGVVAATVGAYTDIHALGPIMGGQPIFSSIPMASAYGGVHAAIAATLAYFDRLKTGTGRSLETPLADALLSAMALLIMKVDNQPQRFDLPPIDKAMREVAFPLIRDLSANMDEAQSALVKSYLGKFARPQFGNYVCSDGRQVFINAVDHVRHARTCLDVLGILDDLIAEGMVVGSPYEEGGAGNNISCSSGLSPAWVERMRTLMTARFRTRPAQEWETRLQNAGVPVTVVRTTTEWLDLPKLRDGGNVAVVEDPRHGAVAQPGRYVSIEGAASASPSLRPRQIGADTTGWMSPRHEGATGGRGAFGPATEILAGIKVLDLANVIAGPAAARILAEFGAEVTRVDAPAPLAGPRMTMWFGLDVNQGKRAVILDLKSEEGRKVFAKLVREADVVLHNFLDRSAVSLGIDDAALRRLNPDIITCQVSAWGGPEGGPFKEFPAFDPVLQAATGITARYGSPEAPVLHGIASCVDYITGFLAALGVAQALAARQSGRGGTHVRTSLSMGGQLVQFPFMAKGPKGAEADEPSGQTALGYGPHYRLYRAKDRWTFLACRAADLDDVAARLGAADASEDALAEAIRREDLASLARRLQDLAAALVPVVRLDELREASTVEDGAAANRNATGLAMREAPHPSGHRISLPLPTWVRSEGTAPRPLSPAPAPGSDTRDALRTLGLDVAEIDALVARGIARDGWAILKRYLPL